MRRCGMLAFHAMGLNELADAARPAIPTQKNRDAAEVCDGFLVQLAVERRDCRSL